jgi:hypothetical protein
MHALAALARDKVVGLTFRLLRMGAGRDKNVIVPWSERGLSENFKQLFESVHVFRAESLACLAHKNLAARDEQHNESRQWFRFKESLVPGCGSPRCKKAIYLGLLRGWLVFRSDAAGSSVTTIKATQSFFFDECIIFLAFTISTRRISAEVFAPAIFPTAHQC